MRLVELSAVEQRYPAVMEVLGKGGSVVAKSVKYNVSRQTLHRWIK